MDACNSPQALPFVFQCIWRQAGGWEGGVGVAGEVGEPERLWRLGGVSSWGSWGVLEGGDETAYVPFVASDLQIS